MSQTQTKSPKSYTLENLVGSQEPSERISPLYSESDGEDATALLALGGLTLDPWQADIMCDWLAVGKNGKWLSKTCAGSVPRQNGKTCLIAGRAEAGMILYNEQVIYTAHLQKTATETFEEMASFFDSPKLRKYLKDIKTALGREQIILKTGARVKFLARTRNGGRGQHGDCLIFDEAQELDDSAQASFIPAISASLNPQTIYVGTPPEPESEGRVFRNIRQKAIDGNTTKTSWFEFSVNEIGDVHDPKRWAETNPALGRRILFSTIEGECEQMSPDMFARERLGWWTPIVEHKEDYVIDKSAWDECSTNATRPNGKTAYGIKFSPDGSEVCLSGVVLTSDNKLYVELIERRSTAQGTRWLAEWLNERYTKACCVVIDGRNGVDVLIDRITDVWKIKDSIKKPNVKDIITSVGMITEAINEHTLMWNEAQEALCDSALSSVKRPISGGFGFGGDDSTPIESVALAIFGVKTSKRDPSRKMRIG